MALFTNEAVNKLNSLINLKQFCEVLSIDQDEICVLMLDGSKAYMSRMGKVRWVDAFTNEKRLEE